MNKLTFAMFVLAIGGFLGAVTSVMSRRGQWHWAWILIATALSTSVWLYQTTDKSMSVAQASLLFEVVYGLSYFTGFRIMGEASRWQELLGMTLSFAGLLVSFL
jgi:drug/metabolite transporter (DMT)-like permease